MNLALRLSNDPALRRRGLGEFVSLDLPGGRHGQVGIQLRPDREEHALAVALAWVYALACPSVSLAVHGDRVAVYVRGDLEGLRVQAWVLVSGTAAVRLRNGARWDALGSADITVHELRAVAVAVADLEVWWW